LLLESLRRRKGAAIGEKPDNTEQDTGPSDQAVSKGEERRRHKVSSQGTRQFSEEQVFGPLGVIRLQGPMGARS
jgi:hypothetical protein